MKIKIVVHPKSKTPRIKKDATAKLHVYVRQVPEKGKANQEVAESLAKHFKVSKSQLDIISGSKSRDKLVEIID